MKFSDLLLHGGTERSPLVKCLLCLFHWLASCASHVGGIVEPQTVYIRRSLWYNIDVDIREYELWTDDVGQALRDVFVWLVKNTMLRVGKIYHVHVLAVSQSWMK